MRRPCAEKSNTVLLNGIMLNPNTMLKTSISKAHVFLLWALAYMDLDVRSLIRPSIIRNHSSLSPTVSAGSSESTAHTSPLLDAWIAAVPVDKMPSLPVPKSPRPNLYAIVPTGPSAAPAGTADSLNPVAM